jgi:hypothetical protein
LDAPIEVVTTRIDPLIEVVAHRLDESVVASVSRMDAPIFAKSMRLDAPIEVTCSIICDIGVRDYLIVEPNDIVWLTLDNNYEQQLSVYANVEWNVD